MTVVFYNEQLEKLLVLSYNDPVGQSTKLHSWQSPKCAKNQHIINNNNIRFRNYQYTDCLRCGFLRLIRVGVALVGAQMSR